MCAATAAVLFLAPGCGRESEPRPSQPVVRTVHPRPLLPGTPAPVVKEKPHPSPVRAATLANPSPAPGNSVEAQVRKAWPGDRASEDSFVRIIDRCENQSWNPRAVSATGDYGIAQINKRTWRLFFERRFGAWLPNIFDVTKNVKMAWLIYERAGRSFQPWSCRWAA